MTNESPLIDFITQQLKRTNIDPSPENLRRWMEFACTKAEQVKLLPHFFHDFDMREGTTFPHTRVDQMSLIPIGSEKNPEIEELLMLRTKSKVPLILRLADGKLDELLSIAVNKKQAREWSVRLLSVLKPSPKHLGRLANQLLLPVHNGYVALAPVFVSDIAKQLHHAPRTKDTPSKPPAVRYPRSKKSRDKLNLKEAFEKPNRLGGFLGMLNERTENFWETKNFDPELTREILKMTGDVLVMGIAACRKRHKKERTEPSAVSVFEQVFIEDDREEIQIERKNPHWLSKIGDMYVNLIPKRLRNSEDPNVQKLIEMEKTIAVEQVAVQAKLLP